MQTEARKRKPLILSAIVLSQLRKYQNSCPMHAVCAVEMIPRKSTPQ